MGDVTRAHQYGAPEHHLLKREHEKIKWLTMSSMEAFTAPERAPRGSAMYDGDWREKKAWVSANPSASLPK